MLLLVSQAFSISNKIKHVIVLMEENRSFDHMLGWIPGVNGLTGQEYNLVNSSDPNSARVYVDKLQPYIATCDPDHSTYGTAVKNFGIGNLRRNLTQVATMSGFVEWEARMGQRRTNYCNVMSALDPKRMPVITTLATEFAVMDRFFAAHPGPTWPNRLFSLTGTAAGLTTTGPWYRGISGNLYPQRTFFDQLTSEGLTWRNYYNDTPWELFVSTLAHTPENVQRMDSFYADAARGTLPNFAWINPRMGMNTSTLEGSNDDHPDHDMSLGEKYYKDIYEALRSSPQWNETLFIITFDEHGGYYDHVPTPLGVPPPGDNEDSYPDKNFKFDRLGVRIPTLLISPWIPKGTVISAPPTEQKPFPNSEYDLTSIMSSTRKLLNMQSPPLTNRDAWAGTFEHVFTLDEPRSDCMDHLPNAGPASDGYSPYTEMAMSINDLQKQILDMHAHLGGYQFPATAKLQTQGQVSEHAQELYAAHAERTFEWKKSKLDMTLGVKVHPHATEQPSHWVSSQWVINNGTRVTHVTISAPSDVTDVCLDYMNGEVSVSNCYPIPDPDYNRDKGQQWMWEDDSTVRPVVDCSLCLTTELGGDVKVAPCDNTPAQRFTYHADAGSRNPAGAIATAVKHLLRLVNNTAAQQHNQKTRAHTVLKTSRRK